MKFEATSGKGECENKPKCEKVLNKGPIPRGKYVINSTEIDNPPLMGDFRRNFGTDRSAGDGDWGDWRVRIYPQRGTQRYGRTGFYLHGGYFDGSAGCIDIGGGIFGNDKLLKDLLGVFQEFSLTRDQHSYYGNEYGSITESGGDLYSDYRYFNSATYALDSIRVARMAPKTVPEPATLALLGVGLAGLAAARRRRTAAG